MINCITSLFSSGLLCLKNTQLVYEEINSHRRTIGDRYTQEMMPFQDIVKQIKHSYVYKSGYAGA